MIDRVPRHKGVGLLPVVHGLNLDPRAQALVPDDLRHYLTTKLLPSAWYPEADYERLIHVLANSVGRKRVGGDVWTYFGRTAARRDIAGSQDDVPASSRTEIAGTYRNLMFSAGDVAGMFHRIGKIWRLYHDSGHITVARQGDDAAAVTVQLHDFAFVSRGLLDLQTGYITEFARIGGIALRSDLVRAGSGGTRLTEWQFQLDVRSEPLLASIATIPLSHQRTSLPASA